MTTKPCRCARGAFEERLEGLQPASRGADAHDGESLVSFSRRALGPRQRRFGRASLECATTLSGAMLRPRLLLRLRSVERFGLSASL